MRRKIVCILVCMLVMAVAFNVAAQTIELCQPQQTSIKKVKEIPVPFQTWRQTADGITDVIVLHKDVAQGVAIVRSFVTLDQEIPLDNLTLGNTMNLNWTMIDDPQSPYVLDPGQEVEFFIPTTNATKAVLVKYNVGWNRETVVANFINEAVLNVQIIENALSNFDVQNTYSKSINNFELELYGNVATSDVVTWYDPSGDPYFDSTHQTWYGGWGAPPQINQKSYGIEIIWIDETHPVQPGQWVHFGIGLKPGITLDGARAYLTIKKDISTNTQVMQNHPVSKNKIPDHNYNLLIWLCNQFPHLFPILRHLIGR